MDQSIPIPACSVLDPDTTAQHMWTSPCTSRLALSSLILGCCQPCPHWCGQEQRWHLAEWGFCLISAISSVLGRLRGPTCSWGLFVTLSASQSHQKADCPRKTFTIMHKMTSLISAHGRWKQEDQEFRVIVGCITSLRPAWDI